MTYGSCELHVSLPEVENGQEGSKSIEVILEFVFFPDTEKTEGKYQLF